MNIGTRLGCGVSNSRVVRHVLHHKLRIEGGHISLHISILLLGCFNLDSPIHKLFVSTHKCTIWASFDMELKHSDFITQLRILLSDNEKLRFLFLQMSDFSFHILYTLCLLNSYCFKFRSIFLFIL